MVFISSSLDYLTQDDSFLAPDFGTLSFKHDVLIKPLPSRLRDLSGRKGREIVRALGDGKPQGNSIFQTQ